MIVISDTSPLITLWKLQLLDILPALYGKVMIPTVVEAEIRTEDYADSATAILDANQSWLVIKTPIAISPVDGLDPGEVAAIALALEFHADLLLMDERAGRQFAVQHQIRVRGTVGVLEEAADRGLINLSESFERLKQTNFRITPQFLDRRLHAYELRKMS